MIEIQNNKVLLDGKNCNLIKKLLRLQSMKEK